MKLLATIYHALKVPTFIIILAVILRSDFTFSLPSLTIKLHADWKMILEFAKVLCWPLTILLLALLFRRYIPSLLSRITELTTPAGGVKLSPVPEQESPDGSVEPLGASKATEDDDQVQRDALLTSQAAKDAYDRLFEQIFGTQLMLLKRLANNLEHGLDTSKLLDLYDAHRASATLNAKVAYPSFPHFIQFLLDASLVVLEAETGKYNLTWAGLYFLKHLQETDKDEVSRPL